MSVITTGLTITSSYGSWYLGDLPLLADQSSVDRYCVENGYTSGGTFTSDGIRFSNDGGRLMNQYKQVNIAPTGTTYAWYWVNIFGYDGIVTSITET